MSALGGKRAFSRVESIVSSSASPLFSVSAIVAAVALAYAANATTISPEGAVGQTTLEVDPPVHEIVRMLTPLCPDPSPECMRRQMDVATAYADRGMSFAVIARDEEGRDYALMHRNLISRTSATPRVWVFRDLASSPTSLLWRVDCTAGSYALMAELVQDTRGSVLSYRTSTGTLAKPTDRSAPQRVIKAICDAPVATGYTHL